MAKETKAERWGKYSVAASIGWVAACIVAAKIMVEKEKKVARAQGAATAFKDGYEWYLSKADVYSKHLRLFEDRSDPALVSELHQEMLPDYVYVDANAPETISQILTELQEERADGDG